MYAVIMAGGFGTRLRTMVNGLPKPMAPVKGKPFLEHLVINLKNSGLRDFIFCLHYMAESVIDYFGDGSKWDIKISYSIESQPLGTAGCLTLLEHALNDCFWLVNGDTFLTVDLEDMLLLHKQQEPLITMALALVRDASRYGIVTMDSDKRVLGFQEKSAFGHAPQLINGGLYICDPRILDFIPRNQFVSLERNVLSMILEKGEQVTGFANVGDFFDIGTPGDYIKFCEWVE